MDLKGSQVTRSFDVPSADEIKQARVIHARKYLRDIEPLFVVHEFRAHKRRIPHHITAPLRRQHTRPIDTQCIAVHHMRR